MNEDKNQANRDDEFDVEILATKLWRIQKKLWIKLTYPLALLLLKPKRLFIITGACILLSVILRFTIPPTYQSTFIIRPSSVGDTYYIGMLDDLNLMLQDKNYPAISQKLNLDPATTEELKKVSINPIFKNAYRKDTISSVEITLLMNRAELIDTFQAGILNSLLEGSPYYLKSKAIRSNEFAAMESRIMADLKENDSLKKVITTNVFPRGNGGFVFGEPIDPLKIYESGFSLYEKLVELRSKKEYISSFELVKPGVIRIKPYFPRLIILLPVFIGIGLIICMIMNYRETKKP